MKTWLTDTFKIKYPIIQAPMFLVTNEEMLVSAAASGIMGCIPALNFRTPEKFEEAMISIKKNCEGPFGVNLIVNKSNIHLQKQLKICKKYKPDFIITSLGSPEKTIKMLKPEGIKILCDVVDTKFAKKVEILGADAIIAVNSGAGGHAGPTAASILVPMLKEATTLPIINAGGVGTGSGLLSILSLGAEGVSMGTPFIATHESAVTDEYKQAIVDYDVTDIAMSDKISGTPCTVIKTPYLDKIGVNQNFVESFLNTNKSFKKYAKMLTYYKGTKLLEQAAFGATYKTVWVAGPSLQFVNKIESVQEIVTRIMKEYDSAVSDLSRMNNAHHDT